MLRGDTRDGRCDVCGAPLPYACILFGQFETCNDCPEDFKRGLWFAFDDVVILKDHRPDNPRAVALVEWPGQDGQPPYHTDLFPGDALGGRPTAVYVRSDLFDSFRDCLTRFGGRAVWS